MAMTAAITATKAFGATSTTGEVLEGVNLAGKRVLVTGVSAGPASRRPARSRLMAQRSSARRGISARRRARPKRPSAKPMG
jgi:hypothetical protein